MSFKTIEGAARRLCMDIDTPRSLAVWLLLSQGSHAEYLSLGFNALNYTDFTPTNRIANDYLVTEYLRKYEALDTEIDTRAVAFDAFISNEAACKTSNEYLRGFLYSTRLRDLTFEELRLHQVILTAQTKIREWIGEYPEFDEIVTKCRHGGGSTFSVKGEDVRLDVKITEKQISITPEALSWFRLFTGDDFALLRARGIEADGPCCLLDSEFNVVPGNRGLFVKKDAKTDRFIAAEPTGNMFLQLGVGRVLRSMLQRVGIDLDDQTINQRLAKLALDLGLATVDLSSASDLICYALVWLLLPSKWASFLTSLRSPTTSVNGTVYLNEKFSSMGNGFTFELETLIFASLTEAVRDVYGYTGVVSVYGDDIICPTEMVPSLLHIFALVGFRYNKRKSHYADLFRESCGKHYFDGRDVTPIYQKEVVSGQSRPAVRRFHNRLIIHAAHRGQNTGHDIVILDKTLRRAVNEARKLVDRLGKERGSPEIMVPLLKDPSQMMDAGIISCARRVEILRSERDKFRIRVWRFLPDKTDVLGDAYYAAALRGSAGRSRPVGCSETRCEAAITSTEAHEILSEISFLESPAFRDTTVLRGQGRWKRGKRWVYREIARNITWA